MIINTIRLFVFFLLLTASKIQATFHKEDLEIISKCFCLEGPLFSEPLSGGIANAPVHVFTKNNEEKVPFGIFKKENQNKEFAINRFVFLEEIRNRGFRWLPRIIKNNNGDYLTTINGKMYSCFEYLAPDPEEENIPFSVMLELIGKFHAASLNLPNASTLISRRLDDFKKKKQFFLNQRLKEKDPNLFSTSIWEQIITLSNFYSSSEFEEIYNLLPMQIVHGDSHLGNIVKSKNQLYLIDFDLMRYDIRLWDLACCISFSFFDEFLEKTKNDSFLSFIESHYEINGLQLDDYEKKHLHEIVRFRKLEVIAWFLEMMHSGIATQNEVQFKQFRDALIKQLTDVAQLL